MMAVRKDQGGFTLLELLLVLGVAAILLIGSVYGYRMVTEGNKATQATRLLMTLYQQSLVMSQQQGRVYTDIAYDSDSGAGDMTGGRSPLVVGNVLITGERNPYNGRIVVAPVPASGELTIQFHGVSKQGCIRLVQAVTNAGEIVSVGTAAQTYTSAANQIPVTVTNALAACDQSVNTITWTFP